MATIIITLAAILLLILIIGQAIPIYDYISKKSKFRNTKSEFMSDLYKLQIKYSKKGIVEYSEAIGLIIKGFNLPDPPEPSTDYGRKIKSELKDADRLEELQDQEY